jgi:hypothetical protein
MRSDEKKAGTSCGARLPAHAVKGIAKAILPCEANVIAVRYEGTAFTRFFLDDALRTGRKVLKSDGRRRLLSCHTDEEAKDYYGRSHISSHQI